MTLSARESPLYGRDFLTKPHNFCTFFLDCQHFLCYIVNMEEIKKILSKNLVALRKAQRITQGQLAAKLNYSDKAVSKWENGDTAPDIAVLSKIANFYGVTVDFLITEEHTKAEIKAPNKRKKNNTILAMALFVSIIWICATVVYAQLRIWTDRNVWTIFIWAVPASCFLLSILNKAWLKRTFSLTISSIFIWTILACFHLQFFTYNMWVVYFIGIPCQIALVILKRLENNAYD